jgi:hypothetical protein
VRELDRTQLDGRQIRIEYAKEKRKAPDEMREREFQEKQRPSGRGGRGGGGGGGGRYVHTSGQVAASDIK